MKLRVFILLIAVFVFSGCSDKDENWLSFVGDSQIARWDLQVYFPSKLTENMGVSGSGIEYLKSLANSMTGKSAVILSGTNDLYKLKSESDIDSYAYEFITAVSALNAEKIYIYSILPRHFNNENKNVNKKIADLNLHIKEEAEKHNIVYIDVFSKLLKDDAINMQYSYDGLHLNNYGYEIISYELKRYLE